VEPPQDIGVENNLGFSPLKGDRINRSIWHESALIASLFVQLAVTLMQQISFIVFIALYSPQHNETHEINAFYA